MKTRAALLGGGENTDMMVELLTGITQVPVQGFDSLQRENSLC